MAVVQPVAVTGMRPAPAGRHSLNVLRSELTKLRTVRSTYWTLGAAAVLTVGLSAIICAVVVSQYSHLSARDIAEFDPASTSLTGGILAQFAVAVLGILVITGEYATGMIRTTFAATPRRLHVLGAKVAVFAAVTFAVMATGCFVAFFIGQSILSSKHLGVSIGDPRVLRTILGTAMYLTVLGLLSLGIGALLRKTAGAITAIVGVLFVVPVLVSFLPSLEGVQKYLPSEAGTAIINANPSAASDMLGPWTGMGIFVLYAALTLGAAAYLLQRRDA